VPLPDETMDELFGLDGIRLAPIPSAAEAVGPSLVPRARDVLEAIEGPYVTGLVKEMEAELQELRTGEYPEPARWGEMRFMERFLSRLRDDAMEARRILNAEGC